MSKRFPKILIIEHEENELENFLKLPLLKEIKKEVPDSSIYTICEDDINEIVKKIPNINFDLVISDVFFPGITNVDSWGKQIAEKFTEKGIPIIARSSHLSKEDIIKIVNQYRVIRILEKKYDKKTTEKILQGVLSNGFNNINPSSLTNTITWLHISDLHFNSVDDYNRKKVETAFFDDIQRLKDNGFSLDMLMITGDIANQGKPDEYKHATEFINKLLDKTGISREYLFIVPGNHDINWDLINPSAPNFCSFNNRDELNTVLNNSDTRNMLLAPFKGYAEFLDELRLGSNIQIDKDFSITGTSPKLPIGIGGINSALGSGIFKTNNGKVHDKGNLFIGEKQVDSVMNKIDSTEIKIAMVHHPLTYLRDFDAKDVEKILTKRSNIILHGHLHISEFQQMVGMNKNIIIIPAGSFYQSRELINSYNIATLDMETRRVVIHYRRYSEMQDSFIKDIDTTGEDLDGRYEFSF